MSIQPFNLDPVADIIAYHDRTKHHPDRYARGPGGLDWATQPNPFRRFQGALLVPLPLAQSDDTPPAASLFGVGTVAARPLNLQSLGLFFESSLGLSARKQIPGSSWYLRINPSSGNLHPTESYALLPSLEGLPERAGLYHYAPLHHALEQRARWPLTPNANQEAFLVALTSITWREAWKYGERAFRYCQHDVGHALAALRYAAAALGWRLQLLPQWTDRDLAHFMGLDRAEDFAGAESETPELLAQVIVSETAGPIVFSAPAVSAEWFGRANQLSPSHVEWPAIDEAVSASAKSVAVPIPSSAPIVWPPPRPPQSPHSAGKLIRQRRSAVDFDGATALALGPFLEILDSTLPRSNAPPFDAWPFAPRVHLVLFVHRITGLAPGLYLWLRSPEDLGAVRSACDDTFEWEKPTGVDPTVPLYRLKAGDLRAFAQTVSCHQAIASDGAFSLGMLARFQSVLRDRGPWAYRELFWEAGMIGQALYLAAEAAGVRGTGIGCYLDDLMHRALGLATHDWQSLYHFTLGGPVEDPRLQTLPPYAHRGELGL